MVQLTDGPKVIISEQLNSNGHFERDAEVHTLVKKDPPDKPALNIDELLCECEAKISYSSRTLFPWLSVGFKNIRCFEDKVGSRNQLAHLPL